MSISGPSRKDMELLAAALDEKSLRVERRKQEGAGGLIEFVRYFWSVLEPVAPFVEGEALFAICDHLEAVAFGEINRLLINVPPGFMKSLLTNVFFPAWLWGPLDRASMRLVTFSYASHLTERDNGKFRDLLRSQKYQRMWGHRVTLTEEGKVKVANDKTGWKFASSVGGVGTGERGDLVLADDLNNVRDAESETIREGTATWFRESMQNRLNDLETGVIIVIMQRVHEGDVSGVILEDYPNYVHLSIPMEYEPDRHCETSIGWSDWRTEPGELAWPERFTERELQPFKQYPYLWAGQYQQRPEPRGGGIIKRDTWQLWDSSILPSFDYVMATLDTAYTTKQENDFSAMTVWGVFSQGSTAHNNQIMGPNGRLSATERQYVPLHPKAMLIYAWQEKLEIHQLVQKVLETTKRFPIDRLLIENKAAGISVAQEIRRIYAHADFGVQLLDPGNQDKVARLYAVQHLFEEGMVYAPDRSWAEMVITQVSTFPKGKHDDLTDTVSMALNWLRKTGMLQRRDEVSQDLEESLKFRGNSEIPLYPS
jgi:predicted phage terminase large subunit-like protein